MTQTKPQMIEQRPITPPLELKQQWQGQAWCYRDDDVGRELWLIDRAAQWGYDQRGEVNEAKMQKARDEELEACIAWMKRMGYWGEDGQAIPLLRAARRPKPPSRKEQALEAAYRFYANNGHDNYDEKEIKDDFDIICRALEALPDD